MAIAFVQRIGHTNTTSTASSTKTLTTTAGTTAGNRVILAVKCSAGKSVTAVSDTRGNTWTVDKVSANTTGARVSIASAQLTTAIQSGDTITVTQSAAADFAAACYEYSGIATASPVDQTAETSNSFSSSISQGITTTNANDLVFSALAIGSLQTGVTQPTGWTLRDSAETATLFVDAAEDIVSSTGTYTANWSWTPNASSCAVALVAYKAASTAASLVYDDRHVRRNSLLRR